MKRILPLLLSGCLATAAASPPTSERWEFLDNGRVRLGINLTAGAAIGYLSESGREENLVNRFDYGRYLQQSWYGAEDGTRWRDQPWRWNPVQAGSWSGEAAQVREFSKDTNRLFAITTPRHWASGAEISEVSLSQEIHLEGDLAVIDFSLAYTGDTRHPVQDQELPAVFVHPDCTRLFYLDPEDAGGAPPRSLEPGPTNERIRIREPWVAWVNEEGRGLGILVPDIEVNTATCYRVAGDPENRAKGACSYVAPLRRMAIGPDFRFDYRVYLTIGTLAEIRHRFHEVQTQEKEKGSPQP